MTHFILNVKNRLSKLADVIVLGLSCSVRGSHVRFFQDLLDVKRIFITNHKLNLNIWAYFEIELRESGQYDVNNMIVALGVFTLRGGDEKGPGSIL